MSLERGPIETSFAEPTNTWEAAHRSHRLAFIPSLNHVVPIPLLPPGSAAARQRGEYVARHIEIVNDFWRRRLWNFITRCVRRADAEFNLQHAVLGIVNEALELAALKRSHTSTGQPLVNQVIAIPCVFIADEAEEIIDNATARGGDLNLLEVCSHMENLSRQTDDYSRGTISVFSKTLRRQFGHFTGSSRM